jgi:hypothetical protein
LRRATITKSISAPSSKSALPPFVAAEALKMRAGPRTTVQERLGTLTAVFEAIEVNTR